MNRRPALWPCPRRQEIGSASIARGAEVPLGPVIRAAR